MAKGFLRNIILAQAPTAADPTLKLRIVGDAIRRQVQGDIVGMNFLDFMEGDERKARALVLLREMFERPCGQWWLSPVHYERGFSHHWEVTAFPLAASEQDPAMVLALIRLSEPVLDARKTRAALVRIDPAIRFEAIAIER